MKFVFPILLILILSLTFTPVYETFAKKPDDVGKPSFVTSLQKIKEPKSVKLKDGRISEKIVHIFYTDDFSKKSDEAKKPKPPKGNNNGAKCFSFLAKGASWKTTEEYTVNPTNSDNLSPGFVSNTIRSSVDTWDDEVSFNIFGKTNTDSTATAPLSMDGNNVVVFGGIDNSNVIGVTIVWGVFSGKPNDRELLEWDMILNDLHFKFGDVGPTNELQNVDTDMMDLKNIVTHELGHALGLGHPEQSCSDETMHGFAAFGETKKRTLNNGDIRGVKRLY